MNKSAIPFLTLGGISLILGGVVSAASAGSPSYTSAWAVAYLVLVGGMAQLVLGIGQAELASKRLPAMLLAAEAALLNVSTVAVLLGTILTAPALTYAGAGLLLVTLVAFIWAVRGASQHLPWLLWAFRIMVVVLLVSAPIGLVIAHSRLS
ncbi:hypothetical protein QO003_000535 [Arthrobacter silviterrae]|uniref:Uncharacterized protein n=1 Tax=Arthrobacter silviterrae TaxID=2026658 RepID=A0ABX0DF12_9MICC|nr:hypothetical protein [Arthrobacter silviterrae]MDQ0276232.1 hypothetical protein [Arthrobacter silviterrae]NGN85526.1 hypothetical protein [Arthrobacter silviterrae]